MPFVDYSVDKNSAIPLYFQFKQIILSEIKLGNLKTNDRLPVESDLCRLYSLSRTTVRQAVSELVADGFLYKEKNRGVFVSTPRAKVDSIYSTHYFNEEAKLSGFTPSCKINSLEIIPANADAAKALQVKEGEDVIYIEKWCYANDVLVGISEYYFISPLCACVMSRDAYRTDSAYELLNKQPATRISHISKKVTTYNVDQEEAKVFNIAIGSAMILADDIAYALNTGLPIAYEHVRLVGSRTYITWEFRGGPVWDD